MNKLMVSKPHYTWNGTLAERVLDFCDLHCSDRTMGVNDFYVTYTMDNESLVLLKMTIPDYMDVICVN